MIKFLLMQHRLETIAPRPLIDVYYNSLLLLAPLNLPCSAIYLVEQDKVAYILRAIEFKTIGLISHAICQIYTIQHALKTILIPLYAILHLPNLTCSRVDF